MCYLFFFSILSLCFHAHWFVSPWGRFFTWLPPRRVAFQFNQEPSWLPIYRHLAFPRFVSFRQITHKSKTPSWLKDWHHPQCIGAGHSFLSFIPSFDLQSENISHHRPSTIPWVGEFFDRIASNRLPTTIFNTTWMNLCPNLGSTHDSLKNRNLKKYFLSHEKPIF